MKALVRGELYRVVEVHGDHLEVEVDRGLTALIPYSEPTLIVDPTDNDLALAEAAKVGGCCVCPHVDYLTIDIPNAVHECASCGAHFTDTRREKRYWRTHTKMRES